MELRPAVARRQCGPPRGRGFPLGAHWTRPASQQVVGTLPSRKHSLRDGAGRRGRENEGFLPLDRSHKYALFVFLF